MATRPGKASAPGTLAQARFCQLGVGGDWMIAGRRLIAWKFTAFLCLPLQFSTMCLLSQSGLAALSDFGKHTARPGFLIDKEGC